MDRRTLIVGSGAAAVATTLSAVAATTTPAQAVPARARFRLASTADHARQVLEQVNVELGLVDPDGLRRRYEQCYALLLASPPHEPRPDDLETWISRRMVDLCGTDSYADVLKIPQTRSLLSFAFLAYSQNQDKPLPDIDPGIPVPPVFEKLEPDFLPVLFELINDKRATSRQFASALDAASDELDRIVADKLRDSPDGKGTGGQAQAAPGPAEALDFILFVVVLMCVYYWAKDQLKL